MSASASQDKIAQEIAINIVDEKQREAVAREAADVLKQVQDAQIRYQKFAAKVGGRPEDIVLSYGMSKLESVIVKLS